MLFFGSESFVFIAYLSLVMFVFLGTHALEDIIDKYTFPAEITYLHGHAKLGLYFAGYSVIFLLVCQYFHIDLSYILIGLLCVGLVALLLVREAINNCVCGLSLLFHKPFRPGDTITVNEVSGLVSTMSLRFVALECSGKTVLIPNSYIMRNVVVVETATKTKPISAKRSKSK